jgi:uncharacterized protein (DUF952 family)
VVAGVRKAAGVTTIFHIAVRSEWDAADLDGIGYAPSGFAEEGFIHCSLLRQVLASAERHFTGRHDLLLVALDADSLGADLRLEPAPSVGEDFPHLYRHIAADDVRAVAPFTRSGDGSGPYELPEQLGILDLEPPT